MADNTLWGVATEETGGYQGDPTFGGPTNVDMVSAPWILEEWGENHTLWAEQINSDQNTNKKPYITMYLVAGLARRDNNLQDANVVDANSDQSLANSGANYIRGNKQKIIDAYDEATKKIGENFGQKEVYLHIEPDLWQYQYDYQSGGGISFQEAHDLMNRVSQSIRGNITNAKIVMDISPWADDLQGWFGGFNDYDYVGLVGKNFPANTDIDGKSYNDLYSSTGSKPVIVNTAHGPGGYFLDYNNTWENDTKEYIHAVIQPPTNNGRYASFIEQVTGNRMELEPENQGIDNQQEVANDSTQSNNQPNTNDNMTTFEDDKYKIEVEKINREKRKFRITNKSPDFSDILLFEFHQNGQSRDNYKTHFDLDLGQGETKEVELDLTKLGDGNQRLNENEGYKLQIGVFSPNWSTTLAWYTDLFQIELADENRDVEIVQPVTPPPSNQQPTEPVNQEQNGEITNEYVNYIEIDGSRFKVTTIYRRAD